MLVFLRSALCLSMVSLIGLGSALGQALSQMGQQSGLHRSYSLASIGKAPASDSRLRFLTWTYKDGTDWMTSWTWKRAARVGISAAVLAPMIRLDERLSKNQEKSTGEFGEFLESANVLGGPTAIFLPASVFGLSLISNDTKFQDAAFTSLQAPVYAYLLGSLSKRVLVGRRRPYEDRGAYQFEFLSNRNSSFPSGHATTAWSIVTPWMVYYPGWKTAGLGILATGTAVTRLQRRQHWLTDVIAGSALGFSTWYWLSRKHQGRLPRFASGLTPLITPSGFAVVARF